MIFVLQKALFKLSFSPELCIGSRVQGLWSVCVSLRFPLSVPFGLHLHSEADVCHCRCACETVREAENSCLLRNSLFSDDDFVERFKRKDAALSIVKV